MTDQAVPVTVAVVDSARPPFEGTLLVRRLSVGQRVGRGLTRLLAMWGAAVVCIFIPLLHFALVPLLAMLGPVVAWKASTATVLLQGGSTACPKCSAAVEVKAGTPGWPARLYCTGCGNLLDATPRLSLPGTAPG